MRRVCQHLSSPDVQKTFLITVVVRCCIVLKEKCTIVISFIFLK